MKKMQKTVAGLIRRLLEPEATTANVIPWSSPVPAFGDLTKAKVATVGINPSNREFVDQAGVELEGEERRFHTLRSLGINSWTEATLEHAAKIDQSCVEYFQRNPYDRWFRKLDFVMAGSDFSYYDNFCHACHVDLSPYATGVKWTALTQSEKASLLKLSKDCLGELLCESPVRILILNGRSVVSYFQQYFAVELPHETMPGWELPRASGNDVAGISYQGVIRKIGGLELPTDVLVVGFNHNIQSSFGVTTNVMKRIQKWVSAIIKKNVK